MKYITFAPAQGFPFAVLFTGSVAHNEIAAKIAHPVLGAGFVTVPDAEAFTGGFSPSLNAGVHPHDADLIRIGLNTTETAYPPPPSHITPNQRLAAIRQAMLAASVTTRAGGSAASAYTQLMSRLNQILSKPSA